MLGTTLPCRATAAAAPLVVYVRTVWVPSAHVTIAVPLVELLPQLPLPLAAGSWNCCPPMVTTWPAETVPVGCSVASLDWQPLRLRTKLYVNGCSYELRLGEK